MVYDYIEANIVQQTQKDSQFCDCRVQNMSILTLSQRQKVKYYDGEIL